MPNNCHGLRVTPQSRVAPKKSAFKCIKETCCPLTSKATDPLMHRTLGLALIPVIAATQTRKNCDLYSANITNHLSVCISRFSQRLQKIHSLRLAVQRDRGLDILAPWRKQWPWRSHWTLWAGVNGVPLGKWCWEMNLEAESMWIGSVDCVLVWIQPCDETYWCHNVWKLSSSEDKSGATYKVHGMNQMQDNEEASSESGFHYQSEICHLKYIIWGQYWL